jgi:hypothetical protein
MDRFMSYNLSIGQNDILKFNLLLHYPILSIIILSF